MTSKSRIYLSSPHMGGSELKYIHEAFDQNWIAPLGPNVDAFEQSLGQYVGVKHVAALSSGTSAIHLALILLDVKPGDFVIGQSMTFSATINPISYQHATPVLIDSESDTWNMDPVLLEEAVINMQEGGNEWTRKLESDVQSSKFKVQSIMKKNLEPRTLNLEPLTCNPERSILNTEQVKPKAIIVTHLYGMPARMNEIMEIANRYDIPVIEDAAEALGSEYMGKKAGSIGKFGILSFNGNKIITTSGGGVLLSDDSNMIKRARFLATQAREVAPHYQHEEIGYNYRMSNISAGIGRGQLEILDERIIRRREINQWYRDLLKDVPWISFHSEPSEDFFSNFWLTCILIDPEVDVTDREKLRLAFETENIETRPLWKPMHMQPVFSDVPKVVNGTSEVLFNNGLCLPSGSNLTEEEQKRIKEVLKREFRF